jgi:hypothetical protein
VSIGRSGTSTAVSHSLASEVIIAGTVPELLTLHADAAALVQGFDSSCELAWEFEPGELRRVPRCRAVAACGRSPRWSVERCHRALRRSGKAVLPSVTNSVLASPCGRDIGVDSLAAELVVDRRLAHGTTP